MIFRSIYTLLKRITHLNLPPGSLRSLLKKLYENPFGSVCVYGAQTDVTGDCFITCNDNRQIADGKLDLNGQFYS